MTEQIKQRIEQIKKGEVPQGYKKTKVEIVPSGWEIGNVKDSMNIINNSRTPISDEERKKVIGQYPYYGPTKIQGWINTYNYDCKCVLVGEDGDHFLKYKELSMTLLVEGKFNVNNHAHVICEKETCLLKWFYYAFQHRSLYNYITRQGAGRYKLTKDALEKIELILPPLPEQEKIAEILTNCDKVIELKQKLILEKQAQKKYLMQQLLTGKKRLDGFSGEWERCSIGNIAKIVTGTTPPTTNIEFYNGEYPWVTPTDISTKKDLFTTERTLTKLGIQKGRFIPKDSLLVTCIASIGKNTILRVDGSCNQQINAIIPNNKICIDYIYYLISNSTNSMLKYAGKSATLIINKETFSNIVFEIPPLPEQTAIANILSTADTELDLLQKDLDQWKQKKKSLMQLLLTGIVRV